MQQRTARRPPTYPVDMGGRNMKEKQLTKATAIISLVAAAENYHALRAKTTAKFCCVIKANAYGHGAAPLAALYEKLGADYLAVATAEEALALRRAGIRAPILLLGYVPPEFAPRASAERLTLTVYDRTQAAALAARAQGGTLDVHLKIDTGMGRLGFLPEDAAAAAEWLRALPALHVTGIYTHLARADEGADGEETTHRQLRSFARVSSTVEAVLGERLLRHAENTAGLLHYPTGALDMVRAGIGLYGYAPAGMAAPIPLTPILTLAAPLVSVKKVPAGTPIGYGGTYVTARETTVGIIPLGYADGIPRLAGAHGCRVSRGEKTAPVIGRVCMDQTLLDLTECGGSIGDTVTVYGSTPGARLTDWAERLGAIPYELLTAIGTRVRRVYK